MANTNIEDMIVLSRRRQLPAPEQRRLQTALGTSESARALHQIGLDFDAFEHVPDPELVARVAARAQVAAQARRRFAAAKIKRRRPWRRISLLFLAVFGLLSTAAATVGLWQWTPSGGGATEQDAVQTEGERTTRRAQSHAAPTTAMHGQEAGRDARQTDFGPGGGRTPVPRQAGAPGVIEPRPNDESPSTATASTLFAKANEARKASDLVRAQALYHELQGQYPTSPEARVSHVLAGRLYLSSGRSALALEQFERYLRGAPSGELEEEALHGKAQSLQQLGRVAEEQQVWRNLLTRFPESVHRLTARERLSQ